MYEDYLKRFDSLLPQTPERPGTQTMAQPSTAPAAAPVAKPAAAPPVAPRAAPTAPPPESPTIRRIVNESRMDFHLMRDRHVATLMQVNGELVQVDCGPLVAVAISRVAREPGPLAAFLIDIGLNPFGDWNMLYYASDKPSADLMDALLFTPEAEGQFDAEFTAVIEQARDGWLKFHSHPDAEDETAVRNYREALRQKLMNEGEAVKTALYGDRANRWRNLFPK